MIPETKISRILKLGLPYIGQNIREILTQWRRIFLAGALSQSLSAFSPAIFDYENRE